MGKYEVTHSSESSLPLGIGDIIYTTTSENKETGEKVTGYGWTRDEANRNEQEKRK
jgi:hypothetical protein